MAENKYPLCEAARLLGTAPFDAECLRTHVFSGPLHWYLGERYQAFVAFNAHHEAGDNGGHFGFSPQAVEDFLREEAKR
mgnify:CR=1 FL=1